MARKSSGPKSMVFLPEEEQTTRPVGKTTVHEGIEALQAERAGSWKPATRNFYKQRYIVLRAAAVENGVEYVEDLSVKFARRMRAMRLTQVSAATVHHDEIALKQLTAWCAAQEYIARDPLAHYKALPWKEAKPAVRRPADRWEMDKIVREIENSHAVVTMANSKHKRATEYRYVKARDRMITLTLIETAARSGEVISLTWGDLHRAESYIHINKSGMADTRKNKDDLLAPVTAEWWAELDAYLEKRPALEDDDLIFPQVNGTQMNSGQWANRFSTYCKAAGVEGIVTHCIRHAGATQEREKNGDLAALRKIGDSSLQSLERYTKQAGKDLDLRREQHARVSPLATFLIETGRAKQQPKKSVFI